MITHDRCVGGLAMSGGRLDAIKRLSDPGLDAAQDGYEWLDRTTPPSSFGSFRSQIADGALDQ